MGEENRRGSFISERDFRDGALSDGVEQQKSHLTANLEQMLQCSKPLAGFLSKGDILMA